MTSDSTSRLQHAGARLGYRQCEWPPAQATWHYRPQAGTERG